MIDGKPENVPSPVSRKTFIGLGTVLAAASLNFLDRNVPGIFPPEKERYLYTVPPGNEQGIVRQIGVVVGTHGETDSLSKITTLASSNLYKPVAALFNDDMVDYLDPETQRRIPAAVKLVANDREPNFSRQFYRHAIKTGVPLIFGDLTLRVPYEKLVQDYQRLEIVSPVCSALTWLGVLAGIGQQSMSRRQFLKAITFAVGANALRFSSRGMINLFRNLGVKPDSDLSRDVQAIIHDIIIPENTLIFIRNMIWGLKCLQFAKSGNNVLPDGVINIIGGSDHRFVDFTLRHPELSVKLWRLLNMSKVAGNLSDGDTSWTYKSLIYRPNTEESEIISHQEIARQLDTG